MKGELGMVPQALTAWRRYGRNVLRLLPVMALVTMFTGSLLDFHHSRGLDRRLMQPLEKNASRVPTKKISALQQQSILKVLLLTRTSRNQTGYRL